jgi:hypothetical protein
MSDHKAGLERLGVLIARTQSRDFGEPDIPRARSEPPHVPESMIGTQRLEVVTMSSMLGA